MRAVLAAESGRLRDGLRAMLDSVLALEMVAVVDDAPSALEVIRSWRPELVILDAHLFDEGISEFVCTIKLVGNGARCLVVADRLAQFEPLLDAGADKVLLKGFSAAELSSAIGQLVTDSPERVPRSGQEQEREQT